MRSEGRSYYQRQQFLDFNSHHDNNHKISTAATLIHRAINLPNSQTGRDQEIKHVYTALDSNGYPTNLITQITKKKCFPPPVPTTEELVGTFFKCVDPPLTRGFATLTYIKGLTEPLTRLLKKQDIQVTNKPVKTLQQEFPAPKFRPEKVDQCNVVYKIPCTTCSWSYIGETKRSFSTRKKEHARNVKMCTKGSNVANHAWSENHQIDFENASIIDKSNYRHLKTLESWHTAKTVDADNNSCPLPNQYRILLNK